MTDIAIVVLAGGLQSESGYSERHQGPDVGSAAPAGNPRARYGRRCQRDWNLYSRWAVRMNNAPSATA